MMAPFACIGIYVGKYTHFHTNLFHGKINLKLVKRVNLLINQLIVRISRVTYTVT